MITPESIARVQDAARIEDVVGDVVTLKKRGNNLLGLCPFHNERSPSFTVSPGKGFYKCFGCGKAGNAVGFVMEHDKLNFPEAIRNLAARYRIELEETNTNTPEENAQLQRRDSLLILNAFAQHWYAEQLQASDAGKAIGLTYLAERGIRPDTVAHFGIGFALPARTALTDAAIKAGYQRDFLIETGLGILKDDGALFDRFRERVMFPIHNPSGKVLGFGGRILGKDKKEAKYLNSPESEAYHKSSIVYGLFQGRKEIRESATAYLTEGYMDVIGLWQAGIANAVASAGTSLTEDQCRIIRRFADTVVIVYDGDNAGQAAALRAIDLLLAAGLNALIVPLPDGHDPDSFAAAHPATEVRTQLEGNRLSFIRYRERMALGKATTIDPIAKTALAREILASILLIPDPLKRAAYIGEAAQVLHMDEQTLLHELNVMRNSPKRRPPPSAFQPSPNHTSPQSPGYGNPPPPPSEYPYGDAPPPPADGEPWWPTGINAPPTNDDYIPFGGADGTYSSENAFVRPLTPLNDKDQEKAILRNLVFYGDERLPEGTKVAALIVSEFDAIPWDVPEYYTVFTLFAEAYKNGNPLPSAKDLINGENVAISTLAIDLGFEIDEERLSTRWREKYNILVPMPRLIYAQDVVSAVQRLKLKKLMRLIEENQSRFQEALPEDEMQDVLELHSHLLQMKMTLAKAMGIHVVR